MVDNYQLWRANEERLEELLEQCPACDKCGIKIQDDYYFDIMGETLCEECMNDMYRKNNN